MRNDGTRRRSLTGALLLLAAGLLLLAGCGGGDDRQEAMVPSGMRQTTVTNDTTDTTAAAAGLTESIDTEPLQEPSPTVTETEAPRTEEPPPRRAEPAPEPDIATPAPPEPAPVTPPGVKADPEGEYRHPGLGPYTVQVGSFRESAAADRRVADLRRAGVTARTVTVEIAGVTWHRVLVPNLRDRAEAERLAEKLQRELDLATLVRKENP